MSKITRATLALSNFGVNFTLHTYDYDPDAERIGLQAAQAPGVEARRVLKTLMGQVDRKSVRVIVPSDREVSMKKLAATLHSKSVNVMHPIGGVSRVTGPHSSLWDYEDQEAHSETFLKVE
jgi:Cys-tRNA(Pro)/Cys-tRNA(Cys) deacylase